MDSRRLMRPGSQIILPGSSFVESRILPRSSSSIEYRRFLKSAQAASQAPLIENKRPVRNRPSYPELNCVILKPTTPAQVKTNDCEAVSNNEKVRSSSSLPSTYSTARPALVDLHLINKNEAVKRLYPDIHQKYQNPITCSGSNSLRRLSHKRLVSAKLEILGGSHIARGSRHSWRIAKDMGCPKNRTATTVSDVKDEAKGRSSRLTASLAGDNASFYTATSKLVGAEGEEREENKKISNRTKGSDSELSNGLNRSLERAVEDHRDYEQSIKMPHPVRHLAVHDLLASRSCGNSSPTVNDSQSEDMNGQLDGHSGFPSMVANVSPRPWSIRQVSDESIKSGPNTKSDTVPQLAIDKIKRSAFGSFRNALQKAPSETEKQEHGSSDISLGGKIIGQPKTAWDDRSDDVSNLRSEKETKTNKNLDPYEVPKTAQIRRPIHRRRVSARMVDGTKRIAIALHRPKPQQSHNAAHCRFSTESYRTKELAAAEKRFAARPPPAKYVSHFREELDLETSGPNYIPNIHLMRINTTRLIPASSVDGTSEAQNISAGNSGKVMEADSGFGNSLCQSDSFASLRHLAPLIIHPPETQELATIDDEVSPTNIAKASCGEAETRGRASSDSIAHVASRILKNADGTTCGNAEPSQHQHHNVSNNGPSLWANFPSHTRDERNVRASISDGVKTRDFAPHLDHPRSASSIERQRQRFRGIFNRDSLRILGQKLKVNSGDLRRFRRGDRSSVSTGRQDSYPELGSLPNMNPTMMSPPPSRPPPPPPAVDGGIESAQSSSTPPVACDRSRRKSAISKCWDGLTGFAALQWNKGRGGAQSHGQAVADEAEFTHPSERGGDEANVNHEQ